VTAITAKRSYETALPNFAGVAPQPHKVSARRRGSAINEAVWRRALGLGAVRDGPAPLAQLALMPQPAGQWENAAAFALFRSSVGVCFRSRVVGQTPLARCPLPAVLKRAAWEGATRQSRRCSTDGFAVSRNRQSRHVRWRSHSSGNFRHVRRDPPRLVAR